MPMTPRAACTTWRSRSRSAASTPRRASSSSSRCATASLAPMLGDLMMLDDDDERLWFKGNGSFEAEVVPADDDEEATDVRRRRRMAKAADPDEMVEFYDPTDIFGDFAEALAEHFPAVERGRGRRRRTTTRNPTTTTDDDEEDDDERRVRRGRRQALTWREAARGGAARHPRVPARAVAAHLFRPVAGELGQARPVRARPDARLLRPGPAPAVQPQHVRPAVGRDHHPLPGDRRGHRMAGAHAAGRQDARCSGRSAARSKCDPKTRHMLLVAGGLGMAGVRSLADEALADGWQVLVLFGAANGQPRSTRPRCCPTRSEYVVSTDDGSFGHHGRVTELVPRYEAWADQCFACGPQPMLAALARLARGRDGAPRRGAAQARGPQARSRAARLTAARRGPGCRCRWNRTWAAPSGACLGCVVMWRRRSAARLPRGPGLRRQTRSAGRVGGDHRPCPQRRTST